MVVLFFMAKDKNYHKVHTDCDKNAVDLALEGMIQRKLWPNTANFTLFQDLPRPNDDSLDAKKYYRDTCIKRNVLPGYRGQAVYDSIGQLQYIASLTFQHDKKDVLNMLANGCKPELIDISFEGRQLDSFFNNFYTAFVKKGDYLPLSGEFILSGRNNHYALTKDIYFEFKLNRPSIPGKLELDIKPGNYSKLFYDNVINWYEKLINSI